MTEKQLKILLVDHVDTERAMLKEALTQHSDLMLDNFVERESGISALQILNKIDIDLVISNWKIPNMSGLELLLNMRAEENLKYIPFIMVSSISSQIRVKDAIEAGADHYITKPYKPEILTRHVKDTLLASIKRTQQCAENEDRQNKP